MPVSLFTFTNVFIQQKNFLFDEYIKPELYLSMSIYAKQFVYMSNLALSNRDETNGLTANLA